MTRSGCRPKYAGRGFVPATAAFAAYWTTSRARSCNSTPATSGMEPIEFGLRGAHANDVVGRHAEVCQKLVRGPVFQTREVSDKNFHHFREILGLACDGYKNLPEQTISGYPENDRVLAITVALFPPCALQIANDRAWVQRTHCGSIGRTQKHR